MDREQKRFEVNLEVWRLKTEKFKRKTQEINEKLQKVIESSSRQSLFNDTWDDNGKKNSSSEDSEIGR